jgi:hypothetical protein
MSSFDFADYLQRRTSPDGITSQEFSVEVLTGGLTNHTARITFSEPIASIGTRALARGGNPYSLKSVVLKHAPPFMAIDPSRPMSVDRQLMEKRAFQILAGEDAEFPEAKNIGHRDAAKVHIPKLIWHDEDANVLWIEDLGNLKTLSEILLSEEDTGLEANIEKVGAELGAFLFEFFSTTSDPPTSFIAYMAKVSDRSGIYDYLADVVLKNLGDAGVEDAKILSERVRNFFDESDTADLSKCLGMVDFWPENVLVDLGEIGNTDSTKCGLVDWEYFGVSDAPSELGMFRELFKRLCAGRLIHARSRSLACTYAEFDDISKSKAPHQALYRRLAESICRCPGQERKGDTLEPVKWLHTTPSTFAWTRSCTGSEAIWRENRRRHKTQIT